jgi:hypothetical protein
MNRRLQALGRLPAGTRNRTEAAYEAHLETRRRAGEVLRYWFEGLTLRLAPRTSYTPDFLVQLASGELELHEVKGVWTDDAWAKTKIAAAMFPYRVLAVKARPKRDGGGWTTEQVGD